MSPEKRAARAKIESVFVDSPAASAKTIESIMAGQDGPAREMVVFNTAAALWVAGLSDSWSDGADKARQAIDSGAAKRTLCRWRETSRGA